MHNDTYKNSSKVGLKSHRKVHLKSHSVSDSMVFVFLYVVVRSLIFRLRWSIFLPFDRGLITVICPSVDVFIFLSFWIKRLNLRHSLSLSSIVLLAHSVLEITNCRWVVATLYWPMLTNDLFRSLNCVSMITVRVFTKSNKGLDRLPVNCLFEHMVKRLAVVVSPVFVKIATRNLCSPLVF